MVFRYVASQYLDAVFPADLPYQISHAYANSTYQDRFSVLRCPDEMVLAVKERVCPLSVELHALQCTVCDLSILKGSAEAEGFAPKGGHK